MGIRDYLRGWVEPHDRLTGFKPGDRVISQIGGQFSDVTIPDGAELIVEYLPEARHGADPFELSSVNWVDPDTGIVHEGLEWALSDETAQYHFGTEAGITRATD